MASRIEDYALLGDTESAALVSKGGSIDWLTVPRFDSPACFAALLGDEGNGRWQIAPAGPVLRVERSYRPGSLVLETVFHTAEGSVALIDCLPPRDGRYDLARLVEGRSGSVPMRLHLTIRFDYGSIVPWVRRCPGGITAVGGPDAMRLATPVELRSENLETTAEFTVATGQRVPFTLTWYPSDTPAPQPIDAVTAIAESEAWWRSWSSGCTYEGEYADEVLSSLTVLKGLTYAPSGGLVAAATTSLPEAIGGARNWDYRYCWLRDATFSLMALLNAGFTTEAAAWRDWLLRTVAGSPEQLQIMYGASGERRLTELELDWLTGYEGSRPVRIGNAAHGQFQLDVYGEVLDALHQGRCHGLPEEHASWSLQQQLVDYVGDHWNEPDDGLWEVRGGRQDFTHSKVMAWVAVDRAIASIEDFGYDGPLDRWKRLRDDIHRDVLEHGVDDRGVFVQRYGSPELDASLLMVPLVGFLPPDDPRVRNTVTAIEQGLTEGGFVYRYRTLGSEGIDGLAGAEGVFLMCSFWLADNYALLGRHDEAAAMYELLAGLRNDVGLLSEEYDPAGKRMLGNFPQAFSHVALVNTAGNVTASRLALQGTADGRTAPAHQRRARHPPH
jgi:GH15 family glucan-1,4-alpha-glucosidase